MGGGALGAGAGFAVRCGGASFILPFLSGWGVRVRRCSVEARVGTNMGASGAAGRPPSESVSMLRSSVTQVGDRVGGRMVPGGTGETAVKGRGSNPAGGKSQNLQRAARALWNLMRSQSSTSNLAASQTGKEGCHESFGLVDDGEFVDDKEDRVHV